jgi:hypothetical protein
MPTLLYYGEKGWTSSAPPAVIRTERLGTVLLPSRRYRSSFRDRQLQNLTYWVLSQKCHSRSVSLNTWSCGLAALSRGQQRIRKRFPSEPGSRKNCRPSFVLRKGWCLLSWRAPGRVNQNCSGIDNPTGNWRFPARPRGRASMVPLSPTTEVLRRTGCWCCT